MNNTATNTATCPTVRKQIGKTTYIVRVHFSETAKETICTTISAIKPEIPGICPVCPVFREPGSRKKLHGLPSS